MTSNGSKDFLDNLIEGSLRVDAEGNIIFRRFIIFGKKVTVRSSKDKLAIKERFKGLYIISNGLVISMEITAHLKISSQVSFYLIIAQALILYAIAYLATLDLKLTEFSEDKYDELRPMRKMTSKTIFNAFVIFLAANYFGKFVAMTLFSKESLYSVLE